MHLEIDAEALIDRPRLLQIFMIAREDEHEAAFVEDWQSGPARQRLPVGQRVPRQAGVKLIRAIGAASHPRFPAGRGARMRRAPRVDQMDAAPGLQQPPRRPHT